MICIDTINNSKFFITKNSIYNNDLSIQKIYYNYSKFKLSYISHLICRSLVIVFHALSKFLNIVVKVL